MSFLQLLRQLQLQFYKSWEMWSILIRDINPVINLEEKKSVLMSAPILLSTSALQSALSWKNAFWLASQNNIHTFKIDHLHVFFSSFSTRQSPTHFSCCPHELKFSCFILTQCHLCSLLPWTSRLSMICCLTLLRL